jgi:hypothetical protein
MMPHTAVRVSGDNSTIVVDAAKHVEGVVGEEALAIENGREHLRDGGCAHGLPVLVLVPLQARLQQLVQRKLVSLHARGGDDALIRPLRCARERGEEGQRVTGRRAACHGDRVS